MRIRHLLHLVPLILNFAHGIGLAQVQADDSTDRAIVAIVSDIDRLNIGQNGFCESRVEIPHPSNSQFKIPAGNDTFIFLRSTFKLSYGTYYCEGDYSFTPESRVLLIIRYSFEEQRCKFELFNTLPGGTPQAVAFQHEKPRSCLVK